MWGWLEGHVGLANPIFRVLRKAAVAKSGISEISAEIPGIPGISGKPRRAFRYELCTLGPWRRAAAAAAAVGGRTAALRARAPQRKPARRVPGAPKLALKRAYFRCFCSFLRSAEVALRSPEVVLDHVGSVSEACGVDPEVLFFQGGAVLPPHFREGLPEVS